MWITDWTARAACRNADPDALFVQGDAQSRAKLFCRGCPVRSECLADSLDNRIDFGVWGGMTERERRALLRRRPDVNSWRELLKTAKEQYERTSGTELRKSAQEAAVIEQFEEFYRAEFNGLVRFTMSLGARHQEAWDICQAACWDAFRSWTDIQRPRAWARTVVTRTFLKERAQNKEDPVESVPDLPDPFPPAEMLVVDDTHLVLGLLKKLPPMQRAVMAWVIDGYTCEEIAQESGWSADAVRKNKQRARLALKLLLAQAKEER